MKVTVAATQMACSWDREANIANAERLVREAAKQGANVILIQELFEAPYFCKDHLAKHFELAVPIAENTAIQRLAKVARELKVVLPLSVFERAHNAYFNTLVMVDADGETLGIYRKSHIPESPGYHEKFYFSPGDTGFKVWPTRYGTLGVAVCWDQWFPETARAMAVQGADMLCFPTAIGSEPQDPTLDSRYHWQRTMQGHAAANIMPLVASNRIGTETGREARDHLLRPFLHRRPHRRRHRPGRRPQRAGAHRELRPRRDPPLPACLGRVPRPAARPVRPAAEAGRWPRLRAHSQAGSPAWTSRPRAVKPRATGSSRRASSCSRTASWSRNIRRS